MRVFKIVVNWLLCTPWLFILAASQQLNHPTMELQILLREELEQIPSASGIEKYQQVYYVVGDNAPWLFKLDHQYHILEKIPIAPLDSLVDFVIPKKQKPDFEAMTLVKKGTQKELLLFGSGSKSPLRDGLIRIALDSQHTVTPFSLTKLYQHIRAESGLEKEDFNIEAATANDTKLFLFNRGKNRVISFELADFLAYINDTDELPDFEIFKIKLPAIEGLKAGFSGADISPDGKNIIFTASVENTSNWVDDGAILGSFVGIIPLHQLKQGYEPSCALLTQQGKTLEIKVESVSVSHQNPDLSLHLVFVTDSDGGVSEVLEAKLILAP